MGTKHYSSPYQSQLLVSKQGKKKICVCVMVECRVEQGTT